MAYISVDLDYCRHRGHQFQTTWSDKTPNKVSLMCIDCSLATGKNAYAAYGEGTMGFGDWNSRPKRANERVEEPSGDNV